ncbi:MAG: hypothetical protein MPF33_07230 [Candidatus Aramenus sp.]|nr:hypothetical protein [Candidatus Aramenus sp.]
MGNKKPLLRVEDPRLFSIVIKEIRKKEEFLGKLSWIGISESEGDITVNDEDHVRLAINRAICESKGKEKFNELLIGIDTNSYRLTIVALGDGDLIDVRQTTIDNVEESVEDMIRSVPHDKLYIGVGTGNRLGELVYKMLSMKFGGVRKVNENKTSSRNPYARIKDKDVRAAYLIALRAVNDGTGISA